MINLLPSFKEKETKLYLTLVVQTAVEAMEAGGCTIYPSLPPSVSDTFYAYLKPKLRGTEEVKTDTSSTMGRTNDP